MSNPFNYLLEKIREAPFVKEPFAHVEIEDFLSKAHFEQITRHEQINITGVSSTEALLDRLTEAGYVPIEFPGSIPSRAEYLKWYYGKSNKKAHMATEGFGIVYRLGDVRSGLLQDLESFFASDSLKQLLLKKFGIEREVVLDTGIQKYLHGYEISPHPDIRSKALTWMLNLNPGENSEEEEFHTHYLRLKDRWRFIGEFWRGNPDCERDWLPWEWCETVKRQRKNNSIVLFSPRDDTIHAVKASYNHLKTQRTQLYGNLWYEAQSLRKVDFQQFDLARVSNESWREAQINRIKSSKAWATLRALKRKLRGSQDAFGARQGR